MEHQYGIDALDTQQLVSDLALNVLEMSVFFVNGCIGRDGCHCYAVLDVMPSQSGTGH
jgi:hypothetical protein